MEIEELKIMWQNYDRKLDHLEKLNKKMIMETLLKKPRRKLNILKSRSLFGSVISPLIVIVVLHRFFRFEPFEINIFMGWILTLAVVIYLSYFNFKIFLALKEINPGGDSLIESTRKVNNYRSIVEFLHKYIYITFPILYAGVLLLIWKELRIDLKSVLFIAGLFTFSLVFAHKKFRICKQRIAKLEQEIIEIEEYAR